MKKLRNIRATVPQNVSAAAIEDYQFIFTNEVSTALELTKEISQKIPHNPLTNLYI